MSGPVCARAQKYPPYGGFRTHSRRQSQQESSAQGRFRGYSIPIRGLSYKYSLAFRKR